MIISVDDDFVNLYNGLKVMNYDVHKVSEGVASDVYVYSARGNTHLNNIQVNSAVQEGTFIINGDNKDIPEIVEMIINRSYSSLF